MNTPKQFKGSSRKRNGEVDKSIMNSSDSHSMSISTNKYISSSKSDLIMDTNINDSEDCAQFASVCVKQDKDGDSLGSLKV